MCDQTWTSVRRTAHSICPWIRRVGRGLGAAATPARVVGVTDRTAPLFWVLGDIAGLTLGRSLKFSML